MSAEEIVRYFYGGHQLCAQRTHLAQPRRLVARRNLRLGDISEEVRIIQNRLNRISTNYPNIPKIYPADGIFDADTERAVRTFQQQLT